MGYRKFQADGLFTGYEMLDNQPVLITAEDGEVEEILAEEDAGDDIQKLAGIISPGFINCHCHLELSNMKNRIPEKTGLVDFVYKVVTERHHSQEEILAAIEGAENEMLENGIVAVGDICNNSLSLPQKQKQRLSYYNFIEASGWLPEVSEARFDRALKLYEEFRLQTADLRNSISPHAPYSVSENLWKEIQPYFENKTVTVHNQETDFEDEFFREGTGEFNRMYELMKIDNRHHRATMRSSLQSYFDKLRQAKNVLLVHNTFIKQEDLNFIRLTTRDSRLTTFFCLCPNANLYIESTLPPVQMLVDSGCDLVLGTDSLASNWSLSILDEMKTIFKNFPKIPLKDILKWATMNGARVLEMENELGSFEKGKKPGVLCINHELQGLKRLL
jgi:aminodeoxyfutalosine deaminase